MPNDLDHDRLKAKKCERWANFPEAVARRVRRSISWIGRAEDEPDDPDARFLFLWIAFNAAYADEDKLQAAEGNERAPRRGERTRFDDYFAKVVKLDHDQRIYDAIWQNFSNSIRQLMRNEYVYSPFWQYHNGVSGNEDWERRFKESEQAFRRAFQKNNSVRILSFVFDRLYVLRNQLVHGGATWGGELNRDQVRDGAAIMSFLVPVFVDIMMDNPNEDWGRPFYPRVNQGIRAT